MESHDSSKEICFIITPIGNSETREEYQSVIDNVIKPVLEKKGYEVIAAHERTTSGSITNGIIKDIYNASIVVANITDGNPNVMYEVAFAHSLRRPVIHLLREGSDVPFDIKDSRYILYKNSIHGSAKLFDELNKFVDTILKDPDSQSNPIVDALDTWNVVSPHQTDVAMEDSIKDLTNKMDDVMGMLRRDRIERRLYDEKKENLYNIDNKELYKIISKYDSRKTDRNKKDFYLSYLTDPEKSKILYETLNSIIKMSESDDNDDENSEN